MPLTALEICSRALIRIGASPITSFSAGTAEADIANLLYTQTRDQMLALYPWSFALKQVSLSAKLPTPPVADYTTAFALPTDCLRAWSVNGVRYRIMGRELHTNADSVVLTYIAQVAETITPAYFEAALITRLSAEFCIPLTENSSRAEALVRQAEQELARARSLDAQQDSPVGLVDFTLVTVR